MRKEIPIRASATGGVVDVALVDERDYVRLAQFRWYLNPEGYAVRYDRQGRTVRMHREVCGCDFGDGLEVDHREGNRLDNTRAELRVCSHRLNQQNRRGANCNGQSRYRGVSYCRQTGRWKATVMLDGIQHWLGRHDTEIAAARAAKAFRVARMPFSVEISPANNEEDA